MSFIGKFIKKSLLLALFGAFFMGVGSGGAQAQGGALCGERQGVLAQLQDKYAEAPVSMGLAANGSVLEVLTDDSGTWTILLTNPQGLACLVASGRHWRSIKRKKPEQGT